MGKYFGVGILVRFFLVLSVFFIFAAGCLAATFSSSNNAACFPGCFVNTTITLNETLNYANISFSGASILSLAILSNETFITFTNNLYNLSENNTYYFRTEVSNPAKTNLTITMNLLGNTHNFNVTNSYNLMYYKQKIINLSNTLTNFDIQKNTESIFSSFNQNSGIIDIILFGNVRDYASNKTFATTVIFKNLNSTVLDFTKYLNIEDRDATIYQNAKDLDSLPRFIISFSNIATFLSTSSILYESISIEEKATDLVAYYYNYSNGNLTLLKNTIGEEPIFVQTPTAITVRTNTTIPIVISDYGLGPVVTYINISDTTIHTGQIVTFTLFINDTDTKYVSINDERLINVTRYIWTKNITITQATATLYIIDGKDHPLYLENITFDIDDVPPILYMYGPTDKVYLDDYVNLMWSSEDSSLNTTLFYVDDGQYNGIPGYFINENKYTYNISSSGTLQVDNLATGLHKLEILSTDNYSNERKRETYFRINTLTNNTKFTKDVLGFEWKDYVKYINMSCPQYDNSTNITHNISCNYTYSDYRKYKGISRIEDWNISVLGESVAADKNMSIRINLNETKYATAQYNSYIVEFSFFGLDATWKKYFNISKSKESLISGFRDITNVTIEDTIFFDNINSFFINQELCNINITFPYAFSNYDVLYYDNTSSVFPTKYNTSKILKYSDKFIIQTKCVYGIIIIKEKAQMQLNIDSIPYTIYDNNFNISGKVYSTSNNISCKYDLKNFLFPNPFRKSGKVEVSEDIKHSFTISFNKISNEYYKLNISCTDGYYKITKEEINYFFVKDTTPPVITGIRNLGPDTVPPYSFEDKTQLTLEIPSMTLFTDENATCALSENDVNYHNMTIFDETNDVKHTTKLSLDKPAYLLFIRCIDKNENEMVQPKIIHYFIKDKYVPPPSSIPSVGFGTIFNPIEGSGNDIRTWQKIDKNSILNINFAENTTSFEYIKITTNTELENISFSASISQNNYGYNISPIYGAIKINLQNFANRDIEYKIIYFRVQNSWFENNKLKPENTILAELDDQNNLVYVNTYKLRASSEYTFFQAEPEFFNAYFITVLDEGDITSLLYQNQQGINGQTKFNITKEQKDNSSFKSEKITIKRKSYILVTVLIVIFSLLISIIFAAHQINQTSKQDITKLYRSKKTLFELNKEIAGTKNHKDKTVNQEKNINETNTQEQNNKN